MHLGYSVRRRIRIMVFAVLVILALSVSPFSITKGTAHAYAHRSLGLALPKQVGFKTTDMGVGRNRDGRLEVFGLGGDGNIYHIYQKCAGCGWSNWSSLGHPTSAFFEEGPAVGTNSDGRLEIFAVGKDSNMYHDFQCKSGCVWSGWLPLGGPANGGGVFGVPAVVTNADGRLEVFIEQFAVGGGPFYHIYQNCAGCSWSQWYSLGDTTSFNDNPAAIVNQDGRVEVFGLSGNSIQHAWQTSAGCCFSSWHSLGGNVMGRPTVAMNYDGRLA